MRKALVAILVASVAFACSNTNSTSAAPATAADKAEAQIPALTVDEVDRELAAHQITPVDVNGEGTRKKLGVVPGAVLLDDEETYEASELPADKSTKLVFYCKNES